MRRGQLEKTEDSVIGASVQWKLPSGGSKSAPVSGSETLMGRCNDCDVLLPHSSVSRYHAKILSTDGGYALVDLGSENGTFVNGQRIQACLLRRGDQIQLGASPETIGFVAGHTVTSDDPDVLQPSRATPGDVQSISDEVPALLRAELHKSFVQHFVIERELILAREIQRALIPQHLPTFDGYAISGHYEAAQRVGGDFYDFRAMSSGSAVAFLGDVAGKGVAASLLSSMALGCLDAQLRSDERLDSALATLNSILCEKEPGRFVILFLVRFDPGGECCYASAGHNTAYVYRAEHTEIEELPSTSLVAGVLPECGFASECFTLRAGDVLLAYSDGLTEAENPVGEMLGEDAVRAAVLEYASVGAESLKGALLELVLSFTGGEKQSDDITFFVVEKLER